MKLIFSCGGGRLGNQLLNLIHLCAISYEYDIDVYKINDLFLTSLDGSLVFKIDKNIVKWKIISNNSKIKTKYKLFLKLFIRIIHLYFFLMPNKMSYKLGLKGNLPKFIIGKNINKYFSISELIEDGTNKNVVLSGWGLREWDLVLKHKESIIKNISQGFLPFLNSKKEIEEDYLFVHIRRSDFLDVNEFKDLNFSDEIWLKSIIKICEIESIKRLIIFSDSSISNYITSFLKEKKIYSEIANIKDFKNNTFLEQFVNYLYYSKTVICNASSLALSLSFLFHDKIYLPSNSEDFQKLPLNMAHKSYPALLNWN